MSLLQRTRVAGALGDTGPSYSKFSSEETDGFYSGGRESKGKKRGRRTEEERKKKRGKGKKEGEREGGRERGDELL